MPKQVSGWWRDYFKEHPLKSDKAGTAWVSNGKLKVYCSACWDQHVAQIQHETFAAEAVGAVSTLPQGLDAISDYCTF